MGAWDNWIGRQETQSDIVDRALAARWLATFDRTIAGRGALPQGIHFALCTPRATTAELGEDGHPQRRDDADSLFPPIPLPRRMWAGSDIAFLQPIGVAQRIERTSTLRSVAEKTGSSGNLAFVEVEHLTRADGGDAVREVQTLVYREAAAPDAPQSPPEPGDGAFAEDDWDAISTLVPSESLLFRFSALTFNAHRIHYDLPYAQGVERYRGLVVHGPLIASLLLKLAAETHGDNALASFSFRAVSPAICGEALHLAMRTAAGGIELGAFASDGRQTMKASATLA
jgi:3-methylfumaryl-CoA hydratase